MTVHVVAAVTCPDDVRGLSQLSDRELAQFRGLARHARPDWLAGRIALKEAYRRHERRQDLAGRLIPVTYRANGEPFLPSRPGLRCSISHASGRGVAAVADHRVGVDIERVGRAPAGALRAIASDAEVRMLAAAVARDAIVTLVWTVKEAVLKALGVGMRVPPRSLRIEAVRQDLYRVHAPAHAVPTWLTSVRQSGPMLIAVAIPFVFDDQPQPCWHQLPRV